MHPGPCPHVEDLSITPPLGKHRETSAQSVESSASVNQRLEDWYFCVFCGFCVRQIINEIKQFEWRIDKVRKYIYNRTQRSVTFGIHFAESHLGALPYQVRCDYVVTLTYVLPSSCH